MSNANLIRAELTGTSDDGEYQTGSALGLAGEELDGVLRIQHFGLSSHAPKGSVGLLGSLGGSRERPVLIGLEHGASRPRGLPAGATALYDAGGNIVKMIGGAGMQIASKASLDISAAGALSLGGDGQPCTIKVGTLTIIADHVVVQSSDIKLGGAGASARVATEAGYSSTTKAV